MTKTKHGQKTHIEIQFKENGADITVCYATSETTLHRAELWFNQNAQSILQSLIDLRDWMVKHRAKLDSIADKPDYVAVSPDGTRTEEWHRSGKLHRNSGPASIVTSPNGEKVELYYRDGVKQLPPCPLSSIPGIKIIPSSRDSTIVSHHMQTEESRRQQSQRLKAFWSDPQRSAHLRAKVVAVNSLPLEKREKIIEFLQQENSLSDRAIGHRVGVSSTTVTRIHKILEDPNKTKLDEYRAGVAPRPSLNQ
jgi:hypothetical protein